MKAERLAEAERLRARGNEAAQRIRASADREVVEIVAEAQQGIGNPARRGRSRAQRDLRRGLQQRSGLLRVLPVDEGLWHGAGRSPGTTMVLSPNSEFFRFFRDAGRRGGAGDSRRRHRPHRRRHRRTRQPSTGQQ